MLQKITETKNPDGSVRVRVENTDDGSDKFHISVGDLVLLNYYKQFPQFEKAYEEWGNESDSTIRFSCKKQ